MFDLSHKPNVLYLASIERITAARRMIDQKPHDYVLVSYLAGLAVESILQAIALHGGAAHDAKHTLSMWLSKCPAALHDALKGSAEWNRVVALWDNGMRYLSFDALPRLFQGQGIRTREEGRCRIHRAARNQRPRGRGRGRS